MIRRSLGLNRCLLICFLGPSKISPAPSVNAVAGSAATEFSYLTAPQPPCKRLNASNNIASTEQTASISLKGPVANNENVCGGHSS
jgi:hypothetical protein